MEDYDWIGAGRRLLQEEMTYVPDRFVVLNLTPNGELVQFADMLLASYEPVEVFGRIRLSMNFDDCDGRLPSYFAAFMLRSDFNLAMMQVYNSYI
jgi:hypothetical protein